jgi:hypothetical protein
MRKPFWIVLRVLFVLLLLAVASFGAFRFGYTRGVAESPAIAQQMQAWRENAPAVAPAPFYPAPMMYGYGYPMAYGHPFGFNPLGGLFTFLTFLFFASLFFGFIRMLFFRRMMHHHGPWRGHMPPWAQQPAGQPENPQPENK